METVDVKVSIYKGNTNRYSISLYVEDNGEKISETTKIHMDDKYDSYNGQLAIQLKPNCDLKFENGKHDLILKGLGEEAEEKIKIEGIKTELCPETSAAIKNAEKETKTTSTKCTEVELSQTFGNKPLNLAEYNIINQLLCTDQIHYKQLIYESKNEKIKKLIPSFIIGLTTLLCLILIFVKQPKSF